MTTLSRIEAHVDPAPALLEEIDPIETHNKIIERIELFKASRESSLDLSNLGLVEIPDEISGLPLVSKIDLSKNKISILPTDPEIFEGVRYIDLSSNLIETFPEELCDLERLSSLDLHSNKITTVSPKIAHLTSLFYLKLSQNPIDSFPFESFTNPRLIVEMKSTKIPAKDLKDFMSLSETRRSLCLDTSLFILDT